MALSPPRGLLGGPPTEHLNASPSLPMLSPGRTGARNWVRFLHGGGGGGGRVGGGGGGAAAYDPAYDRIVRE